MISKRLLEHCLLALTLMLTPAVVLAEESDQIVRLSLSEYNRLVDASRLPELAPRQPPSGYALGSADVNVSVSTVDDIASADIRLQLTIEVLDADWVAIPILPAGTSVRTATVDGQAAQLIAAYRGLVWATKTPGAYTMDLHYQVNGKRNAHGYSLAIPLPEAAAIKLQGSLPGAGLQPALIPSAGVDIREAESKTHFSASIPSGRGVQLNWRIPGEQGYSIGRAYYRGQLHDQAIHWRAELKVEVFGEQAQLLHLLPDTVTLNEIKLDNRSAPIISADGYFATRVVGKGQHIILLEFQTPVQPGDGPPSALLNLAEVPVSRFEVQLPGRKELSVQPQTNVSYRQQKQTTLATFNVPMTERLAFSWNEAAPDDGGTEARAHATVIHSLYAEEGVLTANAIMQYAVTRGKTTRVEFSIPDNVQINRIESPGDAVADWRITGEQDRRKQVSVFLNREIEKALALHVHYDQSIVGAEAEEDIVIPLIRAQHVHRQRGMVALLSSKELTLKPASERQLIKVGENQLPAEVRQSINKTIAHTYKYVEDSPVLVVKAAKPERQHGKFDAVANTLFSLSDVSIKASSNVDINVKSGSIMALQLMLPDDVNFLSLTAPSLRNYKVNPGDGVQTVDIFFTQEMAGQFRLELAFERILADTEADIALPTLAVNGAEVEQGKLAVEALSAVEVQASSTRQLSSLDPGELPRQLILKTTNPILLAFRYVHTEPPYQLSLKITRHREIDTQAATIDQAVYRTLVTEDGLAVTSAEFTVRNSRQQFLRIGLPAGSKVWSAHVDGRAEKPALAENADERESGPNVLIKIINSASGFPVQLVYQSPVDEMNKLGTVNAHLPRPDMVVTDSRWDVYLPDQFSYGEIDTNMKHTGGARVSNREIAANIALATNDNKQVTTPPALSVPASGIRYRFSKLYANQTVEDAYITIPYSEGVGRLFAMLMLTAGTLLFWRGVSLAASKKNLNTITGPTVGGACLVAVMIAYFGMSWMLPAIVSAVVGIATLGYFIQQRRSQAGYAITNSEFTDQL